MTSIRRNMTMRRKKITLKGSSSSRVANKPKHRPGDLLAPVCPTQSRTAVVSFAMVDSDAKVASHPYKAPAKIPDKIIFAL